MLCEYCLPLIKIGGIFAAYKEENVEEEVKQAEKAIKILGGEIREIRKFPQRSLVIVNKIRETPAKYPRRPGMAKKRPL